MDHDRFGLDGMPIFAKGADADPVTGELPSSVGSGSFSLEPNTIVFFVLAISFLIFFAFEARVFG
ncbi:hypothetical protein [Novosphingobium sp. MMS21-SN21R]|uniref:hypothetical protein n=1 Tax=Novosphingobium sp. MMS21-SN21R TaxID=2969298 RepID=UPI0028878B02|nr:hypothetical protein [Novosphingobium sp. MMS21-SN21R]MDT0510190.1 hypothetical protein [Novosphingobium sp. MMS21-SN21R]